MTKLFLDFESRSLLDLEERGLDNYAKHLSTKILMLSWAFDSDPVELWQPHLTPELPKEVRKAVEKDVTLYAWNAQFERNLFRHVLKMRIPYERWFDVMVQARYLSLPGSLEKCGDVLGLSEDQAKIKDGKRLINQFCYPVSLGGEVTLFGVTEPYFRSEESDPEDWQKFCEYSKRDTEVERTLYNMMSNLPLPQKELEAWYLDQKINDAGLPVNLKFVENALRLAERSKAELIKLQIERTRLENPNSRDQMIGWATEQGYPHTSLRKDFVRSALADRTNNMTGLCREVLKTRLEASKTSYKKMERIKQLVSDDNRVRNQYLFMGAARTGRWSGTGFQPQNPPRPTKEVEKKYERAVELILAEDFDSLTKEFSSVMDVIASCTRSAIWAPEGKKLVVCDLSAIENRVLGWLAGCDAILKVFRDGLDPYVSFAVKMYNLPYDVLIKDKEKRQIAKPPVLGCFGKDTSVLTLSGWKPIFKITREDKLWDGIQWVNHNGLLYKGFKNVIQFNGVEVTPDHEILIKEAEWRTAWDVSQDFQLEKQAIDLAVGSLSNMPQKKTQKESGEVFTSADAPVVGLKSFWTKIIWSAKNRSAALPVLTGRLEKNKTESTFALNNTPERLLTVWRTATMQSYRGAEDLVGLDTVMAEEGYNANLRMSTNLLATPPLYPVSMITSSKSTARITTAITNRETYDLQREKSITETRKFIVLSNIKGRFTRLLSFGKNVALDIEIKEPWQEKLEAVYPPRKSSQDKTTVAVPTYDILNSGPRNRFTIRTSKGPLIVHNCGYGLGPGVIKHGDTYEIIYKQDEYGNTVKTGLMGYAENMGIKLAPESAYTAWLVFRNSYPEVTQLWRNYENAALRVLEKGGKVKVGVVTFDRKKRKDGTQILRILLPSGRYLHYINARTEEMELVGKDGQPYKKLGIFYDGIGHGVGMVMKGWGKTYIYGGKFTENIDQAISRDILVHGLTEADKLGLPVVGHSHDEIVAVGEDDPFELGLDDLRAAMISYIPWAEGLPLNAEGFTNKYYKKG